MANKKRKIQQSNAVKPSSKNDDANAPTSAKIATTGSMSVGLVSDDDSVFADDLVLTLDFLNTRCLANPTEFKTNKKFKELRTLLFKLLPILGGAAGPSGGENNIDSTSTSVNKLSHRITESLASQSWESAMYNLKQLQITGKIPKLGSVQRWIRHASVTRDSNDIDDHDIYFPLMDAIIRAADPTQVFQIVGEVPKRAYSSLKRDVCILETFEPFVAPVNPDASTSNPTTSSSSPSYCSSLQFDLITEEKGLDEKTHIQIYNCRNPEEMDLRKNRMPEIVKHRIPFVQDAFVLTNVLSKNECKQLVEAGNTIGFMSDYGYTFSQDMSYGAAGCVWLMDPSTFLDPLFNRVKPFLPPTLLDSKKKLFGLNARFRFYRYSHDAKYRPHVDGSWPGSGLIKNDNIDNDQQQPTAIYKFDQYGGDKVWSSFTFLIYLNDEEFKGGETTFFWPGQATPHTLQAKGIKPCAGNVVVFPHGDTSGALVHEGSLVREGFKYVIRTDVLYEKVLNN